MTRSQFQPGDLVRFANDPNQAHVQFARVFRVHQFWLEFRPGTFGARVVDCELIHRPGPANEDVGIVALTETQLVGLANLASVAGEESAAALWDEVERIRRLPWRRSCEDAS